MYADNERSALAVGLSYTRHDAPGYARCKQGKGFTYVSPNGQHVTDRQERKRLERLAIPPAWQDVWISTDPAAHIQATGIDSRGRKQYMYHPKWRQLRDLLKFYRMILFGRALPAIRADIDRSLIGSGLSRERLVAAMLWILDNTYIRVGNEQYYQENESIGLTTLASNNVVVAGPVVTLAFTGKAGRVQQLTFEQPRIARLLATLAESHPDRLFQYDNGSSIRHITSRDINSYLQELTGLDTSAKDFRTWGGTLLAFRHLTAADAKPYVRTKQDRHKAIVGAVDTVAAILGNTRSVARSSYIHPHVLRTFGTRDFSRYFSRARRPPVQRGLGQHENELLHFLEQLLEHEFTLLHAAA